MCFTAEVLVTDRAGDRARFPVQRACLVQIAVEAQQGALVRLDVTEGKWVASGLRYRQRLGEVGAGLLVCRVHTRDAAHHEQECGA